MTVYIEYVIIDNVIIDYLMLKATFALTGLKFKRGRLFLCAVLGAALALALPLFAHLKVLTVLIRLLSGLLITALASAYPSARSYYINTVIFFALTFLTGGAVIGIFNVFGLDYSSEFSIAVMVVPVYFLLKGLSRVIKFLYRKKDVASLTFETVLVLCGKTIKCRGFLDTGNGLYDGDSPVIVCSKKFFIGIIGDDICAVKFKKITVKTVSGLSENFAVPLEKVMIYISDKPNIFKNVTLAVSKESVGDGYDVILHPALYKENYDEKDDVEVKAVS